MTIEKVEMYKVEDGTLFISRLDAENYQNTSVIWDRALANYGRYDEVTFPYKSDFLEFLDQNKVEFLKYFGVYVK